MQLQPPAHTVDGVRFGTGLAGRANEVEALDALFVGFLGEVP
jgi:hypothetical protein